MSSLLYEGQSHREDRNCNKQKLRNACRAGPLADALQELGETALDPLDHEESIRYERQEGPIPAARWTEVRRDLLQFKTKLTICSTNQSIYNPPPQLSFTISSSNLAEASPVKVKQAQRECADRIKYLICSSTLLSPTITLRDPRSTVEAIPRPIVISSEAARIRLTVRAALSCGSLLFATQFLKALRACPSLVFAGVLLSFTQLQFDPFRSRSHQGPQQELIRLIEEFLDAGQIADVTLDAALSKIKEMECVSRGLGLSNPLPPISRLELSTFLPLDSSEQTMRAIPLREAVHQALAQAKATCCEASRELEDHLNNEELPSLLTMYSVVSDCPPSPLPSPTFRDRRQRNSWHPQPLDASPSSPIRSADPRRRSSSSQPARNSWSPEVSRRFSKDLQPSTSKAGLRLSLNASSASPPIYQHEFLQPAFHEPSISTPSKQKTRRPLSLSNPISAPLPREANPYSLSALKDQFESMHKERRRVLCCFLALSSTPKATTQAVQTARSTTSVFRNMSESIKKASDDAFSSNDEIPLPGAFESPIPQPSSLRKRASFLSTSRASRNAFAPMDPNQNKKKEYDVFDNNVQNIGTVLRTIAAKLNVAGEDLRSALETPDPSGTNAEKVLAIHDSMKGDLENLLREWEESRLALRKLLLPPNDRRRTSVPEKQEEEEVLNLLSEGDEDEPDLSGSSTQRTSSIFSAETPEMGSPLQFAQVHDFQSFSLLPPFGEEEEVVFEAVSSAEDRLNGQKMSREERIRMMREKREEADHQKASAAVNNQQPMIHGESSTMPGRAVV